MVHRFEEFELDLDRRELRRAGEAIHLERQVFDVLLYLIEHADRVISKDELIDSVWGQIVSESALTSRIKTARAAIGDDGRAQRLIKTYHGIGYRFVGELEIDADERARTTPEDAAAAPGPFDGTIASTPLALRLAVDAEFPFTGRSAIVSDALARFAAAFEEARSAALLIGGVPGIGKSRVAIEIAERCAEDFGATVLAGRSDPLMTRALEPWAEMLQQAASFQGERMLGWARGLGPLLGGLSSELASLLEVESAPVDTYRAMDALCTFVDRASAEGPIVLVFDDVQWSDAPSRATAAQVVRRLGHRPIALLFTFRTTKGDLPPEVSGWLVEVLRFPQVRRVDLGPLDERDVEQLATASLGAEGPREARALFDQTEGHLLFLVEVLRDRARGGVSTQLPDSIADLVLSRVDRLEAPVRALVEAGALLGHSFPLAVAARATGLEMESALAASDIAIRADLLHPGSSATNLRFAHQLIPRAVRESMTPPARCALHRRCAEALGSVDADEAEIALHLLGAVPLIAIGDAIDRARETAAAAAANLYFDRAARLYERSLELDFDNRRRSEIEIEYARVLNAAGRVPAALVPFDRAMSRAREQGWHDLMLEVALYRGAGSPYRKPGEETTLRALEEVLETHPDLTPLDRAKLQTRVAAFRSFSWRLAERDAVSRSALEAGISAGADDVERLQMLEARWVAVGCPAGAALLPPLDDEILVLTDSTRHAAMDPATPEVSHLWLANGEAFRHEADNFFVADGFRREIDIWRHHSISGSIALFEGRFDAARDRFDEAIVLAEACWGDSGPVLYACALLACDALSPTESSLAPLELLFDVSGVGMLRPCLAWSRALAGDLEGAREMLDDFGVESLAWYPEHLIGGNCLVAAAEVACLLDDEALANAARPALEGISDLVLGLPWSPSFAAADALFSLARWRGDERDATRWADIALDRYDRLEAPAFSDRLQSRTG